MVAIIYHIRYRCTFNHKFSGAWLFHFKIIDQKFWCNMNPKNIESICLIINFVELMRKHQISLVCCALIFLCSDVARLARMNYFMIVWNVVLFGNQMFIALSGYIGLSHLLQNISKNERTFTVQICFSIFHNIIWHCHFPLWVA